MSLFKSRELWSTFCGKEDQYDIGCLVAADILSVGYDCIIVGSHGGFLRVFLPEPDSESDPGGYRPTDLLIEIQLLNPVLQVGVGRLVSGSQSVQVAVLHPRSVAVYSLVSVTGSAQHGDQYQLVLVYEHQLTKSAFSFTIGPFGAVKGRDFLCVQCLDGTLSFFEQETFAVSRNLPCFLLPSAITYVPSSDSFIFLNANWILECYRYEVLADANRKLTPWWTLNLGESLLDMMIVTGKSSKAAIMVLGERHLFCLREGGSVESVKRLQYTPACLHAYTTEPDHQVMALVVADTATLLVYDTAALCWSSQLPFVPVHLTRANVKGLHGVIVLLSGEGQLVCCYLGSEPAVFVAPPAPVHTLANDHLQCRLYSLQAEIESITQKAATQVTEGHELRVSVQTEGLPDPGQCRLVVTLSPSAALQGVQLTVSVTAPLTTHPNTHHLPVLCDEVEVTCLVSFLPGLAVPVMSVDVHTVVAYSSNATHTPRVLQTTSALPVTLVLQPAAPTDTDSNGDGDNTITVTTSQTALPLGQLFPELQEEAGLDALSHRSAPHLVTAVSVSGPHQYRLTGTSLAAMSLILTQLAGRLELYYRPRAVTLTYPAATPPLRPLLNTVDTHVRLRNSLRTLRERLGEETAQYRAIQRRLLSKLREKTVLPLVGLDRILADTYRQIENTSQAIDHTRLALEAVTCELGCLVRLTLTLTRLCDTTDPRDWTDLAAALSYVTHSSDSQGWEEVCEAGLSYLLSTSLAKCVRERQSPGVDPLADPGRFKRHITTALDRVMAGTGSGAGTSPQQDDHRAVSPIMEGEEERAGLSRRSSRLSAGASRPLPVRQQPAPALYGESSKMNDPEELSDSENDSSS